VASGGVVGGGQVALAWVGWRGSAASGQGGDWEAAGHAAVGRGGQNFGIIAFAP